MSLRQMIDPSVDQARLRCRAAAPAAWERFPPGDIAESKRSSPFLEVKRPNRTHGVIDERPPGTRRRTSSGHCQDLSAFHETDDHRHIYRMRILEIAEMILELDRRLRREQMGAASSAVVLVHASVNFQPSNSACWRAKQLSWTRNGCDNLSIWGALAKLPLTDVTPAS